MSGTNTISLTKAWPYRIVLNALLLCLIFLAAFTTILLRTDLVKQKLGRLSEDFYAFTLNHGFQIDDITIEGRRHTSIQQLKDILTSDSTRNILELNLPDLQQKISALPWVKNVIIRRTFFPNILHIKIEERKVDFIWQIHDRFYPIDSEGFVINADFKPAGPLVLIVGEGAPENITKLTQIIRQDHNLFERIKVAHFISNRRWNLILDDIENGITIKLPQDELDAAWKKLIYLNQTNGLLKRKLTSVDLRLPDKVIVKLKKADMQEQIKLKSTKEKSI